MEFVTATATCKWDNIDVTSLHIIIIIRNYNIIMLALKFIVLFVVLVVIQANVSNVFSNILDATKGQVSYITFNFNYLYFII